MISTFFYDGHDIEFIVKFMYDLRSQSVTAKEESMNELVQIQNLIFTIRDKKVMLDRDLAALYGVTVKALNQAVKRNINRFPSDFMFRLTEEEWNNLRSQIVTANISKVRFTPFVFTEHGVAMLSSVLNSEKAIEINVQIVRAFIQLRQYAIEHKDLARRLDDLEHYFIEHCKDNKTDIQELKQAIDMLIDRTKPAKIGFKTD